MQIRFISGAPFGSLFEQVADLREQLLLLRRLGRRGRGLCLLLAVLFPGLTQAIDGLDDQEHNKSHDDEVDERGQEVAETQVVYDDLSVFVQLFAEELRQPDLPLLKAEAAEE